MSASFRWEPVSQQRDRSFGAMAPQMVIEAMNEAFSHYPWALNYNHLATLIALARVNSDFKPFVELVEQHPDGIIVRVEY